MKVHNTTLAREYFTLLKGMGATVYTDNGCPVKATKIIDWDTKDLVIIESDRDGRYESTISHHLAISPEKPINNVYTLPEQDTTARMKQFRKWVTSECTVTVFMTNGFQLKGKIKAYDEDFTVLNTAAYGKPARDVLLFKVSTVRSKLTATK